MFKFNNETRFIEYPQAANGQYSIKIEQKVENKTEDHIRKEWIPIGFISKWFNKEENKYIYSATDSLGNPIFTDCKELYALKKEFRNNGKDLAGISQMARIAGINKKQNINKSEVSATSGRNQDIKKLRDKKDENSKHLADLKQVQKAKNVKTEKEMDAKNTEVTKDNQLNKVNIQSKEQNPDDSKPDADNAVHENQEQDIASNRMDELAEIREQGNDMEQDIEMDR
ncbi:MAG: hypothetical protein NTZ33_15525 [Bacteroidetes bacterium]|nr:hypothetical protein [Bacteroidota bacterium]